MQQKLPELEPYCTAVFAQADRVCGVRRYNLPFLGKAIRRDVHWLLGHGYTCFIVSASNSYGRLALRELLALRNKGTALRLYVVELRGESIRLKSLRCISLEGVPPEERFADYPAKAFLKHALGRATVFCSPRGRQMLAGELAESTKSYYNNLTE